MNHYIGLDVSMKETVICIMNETGEVVHKGRTKTEPEDITQHLKHTKLSITKIGIETGALSNWLVNELQKHGLPVLCVDARKMSTVLSLRVNKTDNNDAQGIADAMRCGIYKETAQKSKRSIEISTIMQGRKTLINQKVQLSNTVRGLMKSYGVRLGPSGEKEFYKKARNRLSEIFENAQFIIEHLLNCYEKLCEEIRAIDQKIETLAKEDEDIKRLMTVPGVGIVTAMTFKTEVDDAKRFKKSRDVGSYFGMTPRQYSSGETKRQGHISKYGSTEMRALLTEAGLVCLMRSRKWSRVKAWGLKILRKHGTKKAAVAVGRKLAVIMHRMLIDKTDFIYGQAKEKEVKVA
jgi:transposase